MPYNKVLHTKPVRNKTFALGISKWWCYVTCIKNTWNTIAGKKIKKYLQEILYVRILNWDCYINGRREYSKVDLGGSGPDNHNEI